MTRSALLKDLLDRAPVILDGAWGTELALRGLRSGSCPDQWNLEHPEHVFDVASSYVEAGSRIILTNTFRANRVALSEAGLADRIADINRRAAEISREAAGSAAFVFGSMGPSGQLLFDGQITEAELERAFSEQAEALVDAGVSGLVIETMYDMREAEIAVRVASWTGVLIVACMVFDSGKHKDRTMTGATVEQAGERLAAAGAHVVGANCGLPAVHYDEIAPRLADASGCPVWLKPNAGAPEIIDGELRYLETPQRFGQQMKALVEQGASFVGGCCGTNPAFIAALVAACENTRVGGDHGDAAPSSRPR